MFQTEINYLTHFEHNCSFLSVVNDSMHISDIQQPSEQPLPAPWLATTITEDLFESNDYRNVTLIPSSSLRFINKYSYP